MGAEAIESVEAKLKKYEAAEQLANIHLAKFDDLDFRVFTNQEWVRLHETHAEDILVHWPDGRQVRGIKPHIEESSAMFVYAPDTRIQVHPVRIAAGAWTMRHRRNGGNIHRTDARTGWKDDCTHRQSI